MNAFALTTTILASLCAGCATWLIYTWSIPVLRSWLQRPVESSLVRMGEIGFPDTKIRRALFVVETGILGALLWLSLGPLGLVLGITILVVVFDIRGLVLNWLVLRRERLLRSQVLSFVTGLQGMMRGGEELEKSIGKVSAVTPSPLGAQTTQVVREAFYGRDIVELLVELGSKLKIESFSLLVAAIACTKDEGSSLAERLIGVQESLEHRDQTERLLSSKTSGPRRTMLILAGTPIGFLLMFWVMQPEATLLLFTTSEGKVILAVIIGLMYGGIAWARRLLNLQ